MKQLSGQGEKSIKVVLDTNVLISALLFRKRLRAIFNLIIEEKIIPCFIETTFREFQTVVLYPKFEPFFKKLSIKPDQLIDALAEKSIILPDPKEIPNISKHLPDNFILACALPCGASFIVSGNKHLLELKKFKGIPIISPREFLKYCK